MDINPSPKFCQACHIVLGGDTTDIVVPALRTSAADRIREIEAEILDGRRVFVGPLDPPAGTLAPMPHMPKAILEVAGEPPAEDERQEESTTRVSLAEMEDLAISAVSSGAGLSVPDKPTEGAGIKCAVCGARLYPVFESDPPGTRSDFDLLKVAGEWRCSLHRERKR
jgi:hypothetical protein